jgi:hypothetical protein
MLNLTKLYLFFCFFIVTSVSGESVLRSSSKCIFPEPDGSNVESSSPANIHGKISQKTDSTITIKGKLEGSKKILIKFNKKTELYTIFGGDVSLNLLHPSQEAWIWFEDCKIPIKKTPLAVMIWIFSVDPDDINPEWNTDKESWPAPSSTAR